MLVPDLPYILICNQNVQNSKTVFNIAYLQQKVNKNADFTAFLHYHMVFHLFINSQKWEILTEWKNKILLTCAFRCISMS